MMSESKIISYTTCGLFHDLYSRNLMWMLTLAPDILHHLIIKTKKKEACGGDKNARSACAKAQEEKKL